MPTVTVWFPPPMQAASAGAPRNAAAAAAPPIAWRTHRRASRLPFIRRGRFSLPRGHAQAGSVLHSPQNLVFASFLDEAVVLARLREAQPGEVADQDEHEDDGDVVGHRNDRPEVQQRS